MGTEIGLEVVNTFPDEYRFHFLSENGSFKATSIYFERRASNFSSNPHEAFLGLVEFIEAENIEQCFELVYSSEERKVHSLAGFVEEPEEEYPNEFSTKFTTGEVEYSNYHLVRELGVGRFIHITLLRGFNELDFRSIREMSEKIDVTGVIPSSRLGDVLDIQFDSDLARDKVGYLIYLN
jgi:hypothetical protein